jgi:hypothetical protein
MRIVVPFGFLGQHRRRVDVAGVCSARGRVFQKATRLGWCALGIDELFGMGADILERREDTAKPLVERSRCA